MTKKTVVTFRPIDVMKRGMTVRHEGGGITIIPSFMEWFIQKLMPPTDWGEIYKGFTGNRGPTVDLYKRIYFKEEAANDPPPRDYTQMTKAELYQEYYEFLESKSGECKDDKKDV